MWRRKGGRRECSSEGRKVKKGKPNTEGRRKEGGSDSEGGSLRGTVGREVPLPFGNKGRGGRSARVA